MAVAGEGCETLAAAEPSEEVVLVEESVGVGNFGGVSESGGAVGGVGGRPRVDLERIESIATRVLHSSTRAARRASACSAILFFFSSSFIVRSKRATIS